MANVSDIREHLANLLSRNLSLDEFEDWFVPYSWNIHKHGDHDAQQFAYAVEHILSLFDEDSAELRDRLLSELLGSFSYGKNESGSPPPLSVAESNANAEFIDAAA